ncbi:MAG: YihY/virulence factor BrkB family protein [Bacteroidetes bacterium]|nr:YihY/virulence factor BrkB family protein [Bacteroidota bacterium]
MKPQRYYVHFKYFDGPLNSLIHLAKTVSFPGFERIPIFEVGAFFVRGLMKGALATRASSIAFNLFLAIFPAIIFFFTLIPYVPVENFQTELLKLMENIMPQKAFIAVEEAIADIILQPRGGLLSFGFIAALYFSTNGISAMIGAFNASYLTFDTRSWWNQRLVSIVIVLILFVLVTTAVALITFGTWSLDFLVQKGWLEKNITFYIIDLLKWLIIIALFFFAIFILYRMAPAKRTKSKFISAGASLATVMIISTSIGFSYYVNNFGNYNKLYGSLGTLMVVLLWMYFNALSLLIGFELNTSFSSARRKHQDKTKTL